jgi:hypothetical protein
MISASEGASFRVEIKNRDARMRGKSFEKERVIIGSILKYSRVCARGTHDLNAAQAGF